jgi:glucose/arabinose dehydrogenase
VSADTLSGGERGLLGLAFAPDYATSGQFFVYLTARQPEGQIQIRRYKVSANDPNRADPASATVILRQAHDQFPNHNGGGLRFGPDGRLWAALGDGGGSNDTLRQAQDRTSLLGKLLRLNRDGSPAAGNPFVGATDGSRAEIWHYGLRNAFRFSFDRATGDLILGDVGQNAREEVDVARWADGLLPAANWGWPCFEGTLTNAAAAAPCEAPGALPPALETDHDTDGAVAVAGGVVVRDPGVPSLSGRYLFGDLGWDELHSAVLGQGDDRVEPSLSMPAVVSVEEDGCGRVVATSVSGRVARLVEGAVSACPDSPYPTPVTPPTPAVKGCGLTVRTPRKPSRRAVRRRGLRVVLRPRRACSVSMRLRIGPAFGPSRQVAMVPGESRAVRLRLGDARRRLRKHVSVRLVATADGHTAVRYVRLRVRP